MTSLNFRKINIEAYKPGRSVLKKKKNVIKLSANESALGMSPKVLKILQRKKHKISKYPDSKAIDLRKTISSKFKCEFNKIICGSGSDEVIQMICQLFLKSGDEVIVPQYSFLMYRIYASIVGAKVVFSKEKQFRVSVENIIKKVNKKTKIVFIANPNNPTGTYLEKKELINLRKKLNKKILLVVNDAYDEYMKDKNYQTGLSMFKNKKNVFI
jgi:Histidinol-phosphate/aromatic aminotransferase and cobyric acid decarboxylase